jgi:CheY-like chemotaxis protein
MRPSSPSIVLCIDDREAVLRMQQAYLSSFGYAVLSALDPREGVTIALQEHVDAVVLDYDMPVLNGAEVAAILKRTYPKLPIVLYTAHTLEVVKDALPLVDAFVEKMSAGKLVAELDRLLGRPPRQGVHRRFPRYPVHVPFSLQIEKPQGKTKVQGVVIDIAEGGLGGDIDVELDPGQLVSIAMELPRTTAELNVRAQVRYHVGKSHGFEFVDLSEPQSLALQLCCEQLAQP